MSAVHRRTKSEDRTTPCEKGVNIVPYLFGREPAAHNGLVAGSSPAGPTTYPYQHTGISAALGGGIRSASGFIEPKAPAIATLARMYRAEAAQISDRHKGGTLPALYRVLAGCLDVCERCADPDERAELERLVLDQPHNGNRRYVERGSDIYILVCRFVFHTDTRANGSRYSHCLRQAAKLDIGSAALVNHLTEQGGLNALYMARPVERTTTDTKTLRLTESISCPKTGRFTVTLERMPDNTYRPWNVQETETDPK